MQYWAYAAVDVTVTTSAVASARMSFVSEFMAISCTQVAQLFDASAGEPVTRPPAPQSVAWLSVAVGEALHRSKPLPRRPPALDWVSLWPPLFAEALSWERPARPAFLEWFEQTGFSSGHGIPLRFGL
jgi:hypothetical protein